MGRVVLRDGCEDKGMGMGVRDWFERIEFGMNGWVCE